MNSFLTHLAEMLPEDKQWLLFDKITMQTRAQLYSDLLDFESSFLTPVLKKYGDQSQQYKFLSRVKNIIIQAAEQQYIIEQQRERINGITALNEMLYSENTKLQAELSKYQTIEEMSVAGVLEAYVRSVQETLQQRHSTNRKNTINK